MTRLLINLSTGFGGPGRTAFAALAGTPSPDFAHVKALLFVPALYRKNLAHDFVRAQVALPAVQSACAEFAAIGAAHLGGDA